MFSYSVKYVCGQNAPPASAPAPTCSPVRQGVYATENQHAQLQPHPGGG